MCRAIAIWLCVALLSVVAHAADVNDVNDVDFVMLDGAPVTTKSSKDWWETASFYQIYPRSFKDSNGDGVGDLNGVTESLSYLKKLGVNAVWLSPIFKSPMADFGYDIADFYDIQPEYGTIADLDRLISQATYEGIKVFLDFVPNHSSDENEWFLKSANREPGFEDFYIWHEGYPDPSDPNKRLPPNNWVSVFRKSAWRWNEKRREFYFHQFYYKQPDLNYRNPAVANEMKNVLRFWLDRGIAGFRIDAVPHLFEEPADKTGRIPDEPLSGNTNDTDDYGYLNHIYTVDQPETIDMLYQWRQVMDEYKAQHGGDTRVLLTESWSPLNIVQKYFGNATHDGSHIPFNFLLIERLWNESNAHDLNDIVNDWMAMLPEGRTANWVLGNHDKSRVATRLGTDRVDLMNILLLTLSGVSVNYNGEEIGMTDQWISWKDTVDPAACNSNPNIYERFTRDPERTPFQWDSTKNAGFSTADKTWLPVADDYKEINVVHQVKDARSHLKVYLALQQLRDTPTMKYGLLKHGVLSDQVFAFMRLYNEETKYITVVNLGPYKETVNLKQLHPLVPDKLQFELVDSKSSHKPGDGVFSKVVELLPKESFVLRSFNGPSKDRASLDNDLKVKLDEAGRDNVNEYFGASKSADL